MEGQELIRGRRARGKQFSCGRLHHKTSKENGLGGEEEGKAATNSCFSVTSPHAACRIGH